MSHYIVAGATTRPPPGTAVEGRMKARSRRKIEMGRRAFEFSRRYPDEGPGYATTLARLEEALNRTDLLTDQQRGGLAEVRVATASKSRIRKLLQRGHLAHVARVAKLAEAEEPGLSLKFRLTLTRASGLSFRAAARGMLAEAESRKELFIKYGLSSAVLEGLAAALTQFDQAVARGTDGRRAHVGASADLDIVADEIVQVVRVMDALNQVRFAEDGELLPAWKSAANVVTPKVVPAAGPTGDVPTAGEVKPAA